MRVGRSPGSLAWGATSARWARGAMSCLARWGSTVAAALVPATVTLWRSRAEMIWPARVACRLHLRALSPAPVLVLLARFRSAGVGQAATGLPGASCTRSGPRHGPRGLGGVWVNDWPPDPALGVVDLAGQVQVEASQYAQRRDLLLVRGVDGSQGVGHGPGRAGHDGGVLGAARCQVGDASHGQSGQVAHGDAHVLSHLHRQGPDDGRLIDHHQQVPMIGQLLVESTQALLVVGQGPLEDLPPFPAQGRGPVPCLTDARCR